MFILANRKPNQLGEESYDILKIKAPKIGVSEFKKYNKFATDIEFKDVILAYSYNYIPFDV